ncbi:interferon alpha-inducible protein 27-like protein 2A isoform X1 [Parambassis ranga]|uniref:Interferon alpha-inducible protein 27-like protein 2A isoform X1 n=1 Tax=Parambassis ranga TaxID=210632 RepID=A0A6P7HA09_9TELE|nr:interferon alpha-inducible protein 27-like protein 2A isoform X1 [Parambassis ranga]
MGLLTIAAVAAGAGGTVVAAPIVLGAIGFTSAGIAAGSYAAGMMSSAAIANGGGVAAGSLVAVLQSAGQRIRLFLKKRNLALCIRIGTVRPDSAKW